MDTDRLFRAIYFEREAGERFASFSAISPPKLVPFFLCVSPLQPTTSTNAVACK